MIKRLMTQLGVAAVVSAFSVSAFGAVVNGVFVFDSSALTDIYSATFDGALTPAANFYGGIAPAQRSVAITSAAGGSATLDVEYDDVTGEIMTINSLVILLPDMVLDILVLSGTSAGATGKFEIIQGNGMGLTGPVANDVPTITAIGDTEGNGGIDINAFAAAEVGNANIFRHSDAPNLDAPDFSSFSDIVDICDPAVGGGALCPLVQFNLLSLDAVRYQLDGAIGDSSFTLTAQTANNSIYTVDFAVVPVPAAVWLFGSALGLLGWMRRRVA